MFRLMRRLRRDNRGQALVLGALTLVVLALLVVSTAQVGSVVYEKVKLQNAADNLAYSTAVMEARAYNVVSYINRAMVMHYSAMMTFAAYLSHAQYLDYVIMPLISAVGAILQYFGIPGCKVVEAMRYWYAALDGHSPAFSPVNACPPPTYNTHGGVELAIAYLTAANEALYLVQEAALVWAGLFIMNGESFAKRTDPRAEYPPIAPAAKKLPAPFDAALSPFVLSNIESIYSPVEHKGGDGDYLGIQDRKDGLPIYRSYRGKGNNLEVDQHARFLMIEVANAARDEWTAGVKEGPYFLGRNWTFDLGDLILGSTFRCGTVMAGLIKIAGLVAAAFGGGALAILSMFFGMRLEKTAETRLRGFENNLRSDQIFSGERFIVKDTQAGKKKSCFCCGANLKGCRSCVNWVCLPPNVKMQCAEIGRIDLTVAFDNGGSSAPQVGLFKPVPLSGSTESGGHHEVRGRAKLNFFGMASINIGPYGVSGSHRRHYFKGITPYVLSRPVTDWPQADHFGQPCNFVALVKKMPKLAFAKKWSFSGASQKTGTLDTTQHKELYGRGTPGRDMWGYDMAAFAVGRAYYHRHGDWKEPPNFFNPLWKARLVPVREHWEFGHFGTGGSMCLNPAVRAMLPADWLDVICAAGAQGSVGMSGSAASVVIH